MGTRVVVCLDTRPGAVKSNEVLSRHVVQTLGVCTTNMIQLTLYTVYIARGIHHLASWHTLQPWKPST